MLNLEMMLNGEKVTLSVGDTVDVSDPKHNDSTHCCSFTGTVKKLEKGCFIVVEDQDFNCFAIEPDEIECVW
jgi:hypothetical protein